MFSVVKYTEITSCIRGNELLSSIVDKCVISKLWLSSEHIFLTTKEEISNLYSFDIVPQLKWRRSIQTTPNDCVLDKIAAPVIEVVWDKSKPSLVFVISETGATDFWEFLQPSHEWLKLKNIQLSNTKGSQIVDVKWHDESGNLLWCEKRGFAADAYCVCYRSINIRDNSEKAKIEIGSAQAILHNCPLVSFYAFNNGMCIQANQIYLERILMFWTSGCLNVKAVVIKHGKEQESTSSFSDFRDITTALVGSWTENTDDESKTQFGITVHTSTQDLLLLNKSGALLKLSNKTNITKLTPVCTVKLPSNIQQNSHKISVFSHGVTFGIIDCNSFVYIYDIISGKLLQTLQEFSSKRLQVLTANCKRPIFWASNGIWELNCIPLNELVKTITCGYNLTGEILNGEVRKGRDFSAETERSLEIKEVLPNAITKEQASPEEMESDLEVNEVLPKTKVDQVTPEKFQLLDVVNWLYVFGLKHSALVLLLEHVISCTRKGDKVPETTLQLLKRLGKDVLQSPAILLTLFEDDLGLKEESQGELKAFLEEIDQAMVPSEYMTPLNLKVLPFLRELYERWSEQMIVPSVDLTTLSIVLDESMPGVIDATAQSVVTGALDAVALEKMEIISLQEPQQAVKAFVPGDGGNLLLENEDGVNHVDAVLSKNPHLHQLFTVKDCGYDVIRAELNDRRWKRRCNAENATIIGIMFQLLYKNHPEGLLDVLDMASKYIGEGASKDEATIQNLQDCVRDFMLDFLPSVWSEKECNLQRIKIHANILLRLGLPRDALAIFLQRQLWHEAVELYVEITRSSADIHEVSQLYEILLSGVIRGSGTSQNELLTKVFEMKPKLIEVENLFELCLKNTPDTSMQDVFKEQCFTVGEAQKTLLKFLPKT